MATLTLEVTATQIIPSATAITRDGSLSLTLTGLEDLGPAITQGELHVKMSDAYGIVFADDTFAVASSITVPIREGACALEFTIRTNSTIITNEGGPVGILPDFPVELDEAGGGGSSDFSTAQVTFTIASTGAWENAYIVPTVEEGDQMSAGMINFDMLDENGEGTFTIMLYKGEARLAWRGTHDVTFSVTGDITQEYDLIYITGDGTITAS